MSPKRPSRIVRRVTVEYEDGRVERFGPGVGKTMRVRTTPVGESRPVQSDDDDVQVTVTLLLDKPRPS